MGKFIKILFLSTVLTVLEASVTDYYPPGYFSDDVTNISWAHGVNSLANLEENLALESLNMLEADIVMGTLKGSNSSEKIPIMAHPPENTSDLSMEMFVNLTIQHNSNLPLSKRKGMKLDFKDEEAAIISIQLIQSILERNSLEFPIWINADILQGPVLAGFPKVNGKVLIILQKEAVPNATLSLGWTTRYPILIGGSYTQTHFNEMAELLKEANSTAPITFPLRAALVLDAVNDLKVLLDESGINSMSPSVTLWEGSGDRRVTREQLDRFVEVIGKDRVFVDLPHSFPGNSADDI